MAQTMQTYDDTEHFKKLRTRLVNHIRNKGIQDEKVLNAIDAIPRQFFTPPEMEDMAYHDRPLPIGHEQNQGTIFAYSKFL